MTNSPDPLSRREREVMDILYRLGEAGVAQVRDEMASPPSYSAVRALFSVMEQKGHLTHRRDGVRYIYRPTVPAERAGRSALDRVVHAFFRGSSTQAAVALLEDERLDDDALAALEALVAKAREEGR
jgi:predicted transcriptional regulator